MNINEIKKYVINLKRREDRLAHMKREMGYMGWDFNVFEAIDTDSYVGAGRSHMAAAKILLDSNEEYHAVFEDDIFFMPYAKTLLQKVETVLNNIEWDIFAFAPSIHRPLRTTDSILVDLNDLPPKDPDRHRGIFGMSGFIYNKKVADVITKWDTNEIIENRHMHSAIDQFMDSEVFPRFKSYCAKYPVVTQIYDYSNINKTYDSNHYLITYNWNEYIHKIPEPLKGYDYCLSLRDKNIDGIEL